MPLWYKAVDFLKALNELLYMDIGELRCELPEGRTQLGDSVDAACAGAGAALYSATMNDVQRALVEDDAELDDSELHIVVDEPLPEPPRSSWMADEVPVRFTSNFLSTNAAFSCKGSCV